MKRHIKQLHGDDELLPVLLTDNTHDNPNTQNQQGNNSDVSSDEDDDDDEEEDDLEDEEEDFDEDEEYNDMMMGDNEDAYSQHSMEDMDFDESNSHQHPLQHHQHQREITHPSQHQRDTIYRNQPGDVTPAKVDQREAIHRHHEDQNPGFKPIGKPHEVGHNMALKHDSHMHQNPQIPPADRRKVDTFNKNVNQYTPQTGPMSHHQQRPYTSQNQAFRGQGQGQGQTNLQRSIQQTHPRRTPPTMSDNEMLDVPYLSDESFQPSDDYSSFGEDDFNSEEEREFYRLGTIHLTFRSLNICGDIILFLRKQVFFRH